MYRSKSNNPHLLLREIFLQHGLAFIDQYDPIPNQVKLLDDVINCQTRAMGGYLQTISNSQKSRVAYFRCKNRLCPLCTYVDKNNWWRSTMNRLLPYCSHALVTVIPPPTLHTLICKNGNDDKEQKFFYDLLLSIPAVVIKEYATNPRYLGGLVGIVSMLQTWKDNLDYYPHTHHVVTNYGLCDDKLVEPKMPNWIDRGIVSQRIKELVLEHVNKHKHLWNEQTYQHIEKCLQEGHWSVHYEPCGNELKKIINEFGDVNYEADHSKNLEKVLKYIKRNSLSGKRIANEGDHVTIRYTNYFNQRMQETISGVEFIRRYVQHVLPQNFHQVRYSGLAHSANKPALQQVKRLLLEKKFLEKCSEIKSELWDNGQVLNILNHHVKDEMITRETFSYFCYESHFLNKRSMVFIESLVPYDTRASPRNRCY